MNDNASGDDEFRHESHTIHDKGMNKNTSILSLLAVAGAALGVQSASAASVASFCERAENGERLTVAFLVWQVGAGFDADAEHALEIRPVFADGEPQEFRLGSICVAGRNAAWVRKD